MLIHEDLEVIDELPPTKRGDKFFVAIYDIANLRSHKLPARKNMGQNSRNTLALF